MIQPCSETYPDIRWFAAGTNETTLGALCEHLPQWQAIVTTPAQLQAQIEAHAPRMGKLVLLMDDHGDMEPFIPIIKHTSASLQIIQLITKNAAYSSPFASSLLVEKPVRIATLSAMIARYLAAQKEQKIRIISRHCHLSLHRRLVLNPLNDTTHELTEKESEILLYLLEKQPTFVNREELHRNIWHHQGALNTHTLETHIYRIRSKIKDIGAHDVSIENSAKGYALRVDCESPKTPL